METKVTIVPYSERYREAHKAFALRNWPRTRRRRDERYIRWKVRGLSQGEVDGWLLALEDDAVIGQLCSIPVKIKIGNTYHAAQWLCDFMVDYSVRKKGIGSSLLEAAINCNKLSLANNPSDSSDAAAAKIGFLPINGPKVLILPIKLNHVLNWKLPHNLKFLNPFLAQIGRPLMAWRSRALWGSGRPKAIKSCSWQDLVPLVEERQKRLAYPYVIHDRNFLEWRCNALPGFAAKSHIFATETGGYAIIEEGGPYLYVLDWFAPYKDDFISLFREIRRIAIDMGSQTIQTLAQDGAETALLLGTGFLLRAHNVQILCYPPERLIPDWNTFSYCLYDSDGNL